MSNYIPWPAYPENVPVDISFIFEDEKPAGKHGFMKVEGDHFSFEDGTTARFWGVNFNGGACFPEHEDAEKLTRRLAKMGVNIIRFHQLDAEWNNPNIFAYSKGKNIDSNRKLDPESMDRLDYLIYCMKKQGIYTYMDLLTYRRFKTKDGARHAEQLPDSAKPYSIFNRQMIELQKEFASQIFEHVNPYTKLAYKDDPSFVMTEITNECDLFTHQMVIEPYVSEFRGLFRKWLDENGINYDAEHCVVNGNTDAPLIQFKSYLHVNYYREMYQHLRNIGVKYPINGTNWTQNMELLKANLVTDYLDTHPYYYDWRWGEKDKYCMNLAMTQTCDSIFSAGAMMRVFNKPFFMSEWDMPWPNEYRAESPILLAAVGALQGWSGFAIHTYAYRPDLSHMKILGKEVSSDTIGSIPYREGIFSTWNDPAKVGLFYHSALITRRGDIAKAKNKIAVRIKDMTDTNHAGSQLEKARLAKDGDHSAIEMQGKPAFSISPEMSAIGCYFEDMPETKADASAVVDEKTCLIKVSAGAVTSDTGEMYRSWEKNYGTIDSAMTKCAYGFLGKNKAIELTGVTIKSITDFSVIAMSSLTAQPINESNNILLTAVGRARNHGAVFEGEKLISWGEAPIEIEAIEAEIEMDAANEHLKVWSVNAEGQYTGVVPSEYDGCTLKFKIGSTMRGMYYLIQGE